MKHASSRILYDYWNTHRRGRAAPDRAEIDPAEIAPILADAVLLGASASGEMLFRLAGTRVCGLFGRELKGLGLASLFQSADRESVRALLADIGTEPMAAVAGLSGSIAEGVGADLELLLLPLRHRGRTDIRFVGTLAPINRPYWLGVLPIRTLALGTFRSVGPLPSARRSRPIIPPVPHRRPGHGLVVYDGGRR